MSMMLQTEHLSFTYPAEEGVSTSTTALEDVSLSIEKGSFVVVLGHNGSGKSTLAKHMNAVLLPSGGAVYVEGMDTKDEALLLEIRRRVGMVFQNPDNQIVANVVEEDVAFAPENLGVPSEEIRRRVDDALAAVGMSEFTRHAPHLLSGGQKQRVAIARMLMQRAPIMIFDDSLSAVDAETDAKIRDALDQNLGGSTVILISHRITTLMKADCILVLSNGQIAQMGRCGKHQRAGQAEMGKQRLALLLPPVDDGLELGKHHLAEYGGPELL